MLKRWEVIIPNDQVSAFRDLLIDSDPKTSEILCHSNTNDTKWIVCWPIDEFKVIAKLSFTLTEVPAFGTEIDFSD